MSDTFGLQFNVKKFYFDTFLVTDALDKATLQFLRHASLKTRLVARRSMKRRKKIAQPGKPPSAHRGDLKEKVQAAMDPSLKFAVVGPELLNQVDELNGKFRSGTIPELLEYGGVSGVIEQQKRPGGQWTRVDKRRRANDNPKRVRRVKYNAFPYMTPALAVVQPSMPAMWANSVK